MHCAGVLVALYIALLLPSVSGAALSDAVCTADTLFAGSWSVKPEPDVVKAGCPSVLSQARYHCEERPPRQADFVPVCRVPTAAETFATLAERVGDRTIVFVGDSLTNQVYASFACAAERAGVRLRLLHVQQFFLRDGLPCAPACTLAANATEYSDGIGLCGGCSDNRATHRALNSSIWTSTLTPAPYAVLLGTGAWYNQNKGFDPSKVVTEYHRTLHEVRKTLEQQLNADTMLLWLGLPPATNKHFGHDKFPLFDRQASDMLYAASLPLAFFFNTSAGTRARAEADPNLFYDGLHWCNWGATTVPEFLIDRLVHVLLNRESFHTAFRSPMARSGSALASTSPHALLVPSPPPAISSVEPAAAASSPFSEQLPAGIADGALVADVVAAFFSSSPLPPLNLSACVFMRGRDEARYLQEWLVYHRLIGFQHFYLYDTDSSAESSSALRPLVDLGLVTIVDWSKSGSHGAQLEDCFMRSDRPTRWMSDWDIDEFLFVDGLQPSAAALRGSAQFPLHLLVRYMETRRMGALVLHRKNYGSNGHATPPNDLVMSAYTMSLPFSSAGEPCITDPGKILQFLPAQHRRPDHSAVNKPGWRIVNANLRNFTPWLADAREVADAPADNCVPPHMHLKHYFSRSVEECIFKQNISNGDSGGTWRAARGPSWCYEIDVSDTTQPAETGFFSAYRDNSLAITLFPAVVRAIIAQF